MSQPISSFDWIALLRGLTPAAQAHVNSAGGIARQLWCSYAGVEHLLAALVISDNSLTCRLLQAQGVEPSLLLYKLRELFPSDETAIPASITPTRRLFAVLEQAIALARANGQSQADERCLLLALLDQAETPPVRILARSLQEAGYTLDEFCAAARAAALPPANAAMQNGADDQEPPPQDPIAESRSLANLGAQFAQEGRLAEALMAINRAIQFDPANPEAYNNLSNIYERMRRHEDALACLQKALELDPNYQLAVFNLAAQLHHLERKAEAEAQVRRSLQLKPDHAGSHALLGMLLSERGEDQLALQSLDQALELNPDLQWACMQRGMTRMITHNFAGALADFNHALALNPTDLRSLGMRGWARYWQGDNQGAVDDATRAISVERDLGVTPDVNLKLRGMALYRLGRLEDAERDLLAALQRDDDAETAQTLGLVYQALGDFEASLDYLSRSLATKPNDPDSYFYRANTLNLLNRHTEALADLDRAIGLRPDFQVAYVNRFGQHMRLGNQAAALEDLQKGLELNPQDPVALYNLASVMIGSGETEAGLEALDRAARLGNLAAAHMAALLRQEGARENVANSNDRSAAPASRLFDLYQHTLEAFKRVRSPAELEDIAQGLPLLYEPAFQRAAFQHINDLPADQRPAYQRRLAWLDALQPSSQADASYGVRPGDRIGDRFLVYDVRRGGMGEIYLCMDLETSYPYALKTVQPRFYDDPAIRRRFETETHNWVSLGKHPHIVRCYGLLDLDHRLYLQLEWVKGPDNLADDLAHLLRRGPVPVRQAFELSIDIARGLAYAEETLPGIVHRDLTPGNVLIAEGGQARITDFGLSAAPALDAEQPERLAPAGTPPYMAPEAWRDAPADIRTDIYAFGCLVYELLVGRPPYVVSLNGDGPQAYVEWLTAYRRQHEDARAPALPPLSGPGADAAGRLESVIRTCLAKSPAGRYPTAAALLRSLEQLFLDAYGEPCPTPPQEGGYTAHDFLMRGLTYLQIDRNDQAIDDFTHALALDPQRLPAYNNRGNALNLLGRYEDAITDFQHALELDPDYAPAHLGLSTALRSLKRYDEALAAADAGLVLRPDLPHLHISRAQILQSLGRAAEALEEYERGIQLDPRDARYHLLRADMYFELGRHSDALGDLDQAVALDPLSARALRDRARARTLLGQPDGAIEDCTHALQIQPDDFMTYLNRGLAQHAVQQYEQAVEDFSAALRLQPDFFPALITRSVALSFLHREGESLRDAERAAVLKPSEAGVFEARAIALNGLGRYDEALADVQHALELDPDRTTAAGVLDVIQSALQREHAALRQRPATPQTSTAQSERTAEDMAKHAYALGKQGDFARAFELLDAAEALYPDEPSISLIRGHLFFDQERHEDAIRQYDIVLRLEPNLDRAHSSRGNSLTRLERYDEALACHERAIAIDPQHAMHYFNRGGTYATMGDEARAIADWRQALALDPSLLAAHQNLANLLFMQRQWYQALFHLSVLAQAGNAEAQQQARAIHEALQMGFYALLTFDTPEDLLHLLDDAPFLADPDCIESMTPAALQQATPDQAAGLQDRLAALWLAGQPQSTTERQRRGDALLKLGKFAEALSDFKAAAAQDPQTQSAYIGWAYALYNLKRFDETVVVCDQLLQLNPEHARGVFIKGMALSESQSVAVVLLYMNRSIALDPNFSDPYIVRASIFALTDPESALTDLAKAEALGDARAAPLADRIRQMHRAGG